jgi:antitoxin ParD1/3/4
MSELSELRRRLNDFVETEIGEGRYQNAEDVVHAIARLLSARENKLAALRAALEEGEASGSFEPFDFDAFIARKMKEYTKISS